MASNTVRVNKFLPLATFLAGIGMYMLFDSPNGDAIRWPGISLMVVGTLLAIWFQIKNKARNRLISRLFVISLICLGISIISFGGLWSGIEFGREPNVLFALSDVIFYGGFVVIGGLGLLTLFVSTLMFND